MECEKSMISVGKITMPIAPNIFLVRLVSTSNENKLKTPLIQFILFFVKKSIYLGRNEV